MIVMLVLACLQGPCLPANEVKAASSPLHPRYTALPKLHYLDLVVALQHKDVAAATKALHRCVGLKCFSAGQKAAFMQLCPQQQVYNFQAYTLGGQIQWQHLAMIVPLVWPVV